MLPFIKELKYGDKGEEVGSLQQRLLDIGFKRCLLNGEVKDLKVDNIFGKITRECLENFQCKVQDVVSELYIPEYIRVAYPFSIDGIMNFSDYYLLNNFEKLIQFYKVNFKIELPEISTQNQLIQRVIEIAKKEIGVVEDKPYNNSGKRVDEYQWIGSCNKIKSGSPWCQFFMNWLLKQLTDKQYRWTCSGYTPDNVNFAIKNNCGKKFVNPEDIRIGDFGYIYSASRNNARHVFLIVDINLKDNYVITIEGNTNNDGSSEGFGVFLRKRRINQVWAVAHWYELYK